MYIIWSGSSHVSENRMEVDTRVRYVEHRKETPHTSSLTLHLHPSLHIPQQHADTDSYMQKECKCFHGYVTEKQVQEQKKEQ